MTLFEHIVNESLLLTEITSARDNDIKAAINKMLRVRVSYDDKKDKVISKSKGKKERYILPVAYGVTNNGKRAVRAYQTAGSTKRGNEKWKLFLLDNIYSWSNTRRSFKDKGQFLLDNGLNPEGEDKHFRELFAVTPITPKGSDNVTDSKPIGPAPVTKNDVVPTKQTNTNAKVKTADKNFGNQQNIPNDTIDNNIAANYNDNKTIAPDTRPINKTDVTPSPQPDLEPVPNVELPKTEPITKDDVMGEPMAANNKLSDTFKNMNQRWDNMYKDNDEEEEL